MLGILIYELVTNQKAQGTPFSFKVIVFLVHICAPEGLTVV